MVVDDSEEIRMMLEGILEGAEYKVMTADTAESAWTILKGADPVIKVMLLDRIMPGMSGTELVKKIRQDPEIKDVQIIMQSSLTSDKDIADGTDAGANKYIAKPFEYEIVISMVKSCLKDYDNLESLRDLSDLSDDFKTKLLTVFSHGFRTPLNAIIGFSDLLLDTEELNEETREGLESILEAGNDLLQFVEDSLLLIQLKSSNYELADHLQPASLPILLEEINHKFQKAAQEKNVTVDLKISKPVNLMVDSSLLKRAIGYGVDNAIKFSPSGGAVTIATETVSESHIVIHITDQGPGIDPDLKDRVFEEFSIQDVLHLQKGFGISLALVNRICILMGGTVSIDNQPGKGATLTMTLPVITEDP